MKTSLAWAKQTPYDVKRELMLKFCDTDIGAELDDGIHYETKTNEEIHDIVQQLALYEQLKRETPFWKIWWRNIKNKFN